MNILETYLTQLQEVGFAKFPKGWTKDSIQKFAKSIGGDAKSKGWFDKCLKKIKGKFDNPEAFCASVKDEIHGGDKASAFWRGKGKTKRQAQQTISSMRAKLKKK